MTDCKGCAKPIVLGDLRRGDDWHADCFMSIFDEVRRAPAKPRRRRGLTETQVIILEAANAPPTGSVQFGAGDRRGTRVIRVDDMGRPLIVAYSNPEWFLLGRGLLERANEPFVFRITDAGRAALA